MAPTDKSERPNTAVPLSLLCAKVILCCGEDYEELVAAHAVAAPRAGAHETHQFRGYRFTRFSNAAGVPFTLAWAGIGTGAVEPLLREILRPGIVREIVLVGTAGYLGSDPQKLGRAHIIDEAVLVGCAVHLEDKDLPLRPNFPGLEQLGLSSIRCMSTDHYYACSPRDEPYANRARATALGMILEASQILQTEFPDPADFNPTSMAGGSDEFRSQSRGRSRS